MDLKIENSGFENYEINTVVPCNATATELLPFQSNSSIVFKIRINDKFLLLKRIIPEYREHPAYINALEKEFNLGFNLDHPNIVKYLNKGRDAEGLYILAEFIDGSTLRDILFKNPKGIKDSNLIEKITFQLLDALNYLHNQQIFHLDLKPENIIITHKGNNVKIIDFGLSYSDSYVSVSSGTKKYSSPEQLKNPKSADARSDFYSFGLILLEMITGSTDLTGLRKASSRYRKIILKCIEPLQENRFNTVDEVTTALNKKNKTKYTITFLVIVLLILSIVIWFNYFKTIRHTNIATSIKPHQILNDANETKINSIINTKSVPNKEILNSSNIRDSIFRKVPNDIHSKSLIKDSLYCCRMGDNIFSNFIEQVNEFDKNPTNKNRKLVLLNIQSHCNDNYNDSIENYLSKYEKGSLSFIKFYEMYSNHANNSNKKIDGLVFKK